VVKRRENVAGAWRLEWILNCALRRTSKRARIDYFVARERQPMAG
jgi:hypothetical protein